MMNRVAIYARYSSDLQRDSSIEDQIRLCTERAERDDWSVINAYTDHGLSGASMSRPGIQMLMRDAQDGKFDIILAEGLDRLSRDQEDIAGIYKRLQFAGIRVVTLADGEVSDIHIGLKGTMNALYLKDLADKTRRGQSGRVRNGKSGGGIGYGYEVVKQFDAHGTPVRGDRKINEDQAAIVRRIFTEFAAGHSPRAIAVRLNEDGIPGPSKKAWGPSTLYGNRKRGTGILNNELYIGRLIWNRQRFIKDPDTGKRIARPNPEEHWIIQEVPELRIIDQNLWDTVKARQKVMDNHGSAFWKKRRPKLLFSHLLKCGCCGGGFSKVSGTRYGCSVAKNKGTCDNRLLIRQDRLENTVLDALQQQLMDPELIQVFCEEYTRHLNELRREHNQTAHRHKRELEKLDKERSLIIQAIKDGIPASELKSELERITARKQELEELLENTEESPVLIHPRMAERYRQEVTALREALNDEESRTEAAGLLRSLIDKIVLRPDEKNEALLIDLHGDLAGILTTAIGYEKRTNQEKALLKQIRLVTLEDDQPNLKEKVVAGARFELTTFGL